jgi:hypothetical protein
VLAEQIYHALHANNGQGVAVNMTTGEIIDL